jgi:hypothetical protein
MLILAAMMLLIAKDMPTLAQTDATTTPVATVFEPSSTVNAMFYACPNAGFIQLDGTLLSGWSIYFQFFNGADGTGTALTSLRQANASGDFSYSEQVAFASGTTIATGAVASARVIVARTGDSSSVDFEFTATDTQDGCGTQLTTTGTSVDAGGGTTTTTTTTGQVGITRPILAPNGVLNPNLQPEPTVVVGARPSDQFRSQTPGLIFAECDEYALALPGLVYDNDQVTVYWSWFTRTEEQMEQHFANAQYSVKMNGAAFNNVQRSEVTRRDGNYWVFYQANAGQLRPGHYEVEYRLTWANPVNDGYDDYGPGTANSIEAGNCNFDVLRNPQNSSVDYNDEFFPSAYPIHNITPND